MTYTILHGDVLDQLRALPAESVQCCVTSPPYWGFRDYKIPGSVWGGDPSCTHVWGDTIVERATNHTGKARWNHARNGRGEDAPTDKLPGWKRTDIAQGQFCQSCGAWFGALGLEPTFTLYVDHIVSVFAEVQRVLRADGTLWLNLGDSYANDGKWGGETGGKQAYLEDTDRKRVGREKRKTGLKPKDLCGIPWRCAIALQAWGWYLRSDIIWAKPNPMPESVTDRPTRSHEYIFLLTKSERYYYDHAAIREPSITNDLRRPYTSQGAWDLDGRPVEQRHGGEPRACADTDRIVRQRPEAKSAPTRERNGIRPRGHERPHQGFNEKWDAMSKDEQQMHGRNKRSVWTIATAPYPDAHFATFPPRLIEPCILAGSRPDDLVLDPFSGAGTTLLVALQHGRRAIGIELNLDYIAMTERRIEKEIPLLVSAGSHP